MKKSTLNSVIWYLVGIVVLFVFWYVLSLIIGEGTLVFPGPFETIIETGNILSKRYVYSCMLSSFERMILGFIISLILALILGIISGNSSKFKKILMPLITCLKSIPTASLVFLFLVLVGARNAPILMVILISFPILYESIVGGIEQIDKNIIEASRLDCSNFLKKIVFIQFPLMLPSLFIGMSSSFALAFKIEIMAEILTGDTRNGLGSAILASQKNDPTNMVPVFAYSLIAIAFILLISFINKIVKQKFAKIN